MIARALDWRNWTPRMRRMAFGFAVGAAMPIGSAIIAASMDTYLHVKAPSMTFLCSVILAALWFGRHVGLATALFAFFIYNFYLTEPRNTFGFAGIEDMLTLLVFTSTALLIGTLTGNLHDARERAEAQVRMFSGLFRSSRVMADVRDPREALAQLVSGAVEIAARDAAIVERGENGRAVVKQVAGVMPPQAVIDACVGPRLIPDGAQAWRLQPVEVGVTRFAVLAWRPLGGPNDAQQDIAVKLLAELASIAIQRAEYVHQQMEMETIAATDKLRTALMSSISHDFRTPLSTIMTSASSLTLYGGQFSEATRADLLASIQEEAERLNRYVGNILDMTRLEGGGVRLREEWIDPAELMEGVAERMQRRLDGRTFSVVAPAAAPAIFVDPLLLEQAVVNVIENALTHTPREAAIRLGADYTNDAVRLWVEDEGPGVAPENLALMFDKFQRLKDARNHEGAGLGLAISKGFAEAMHGQIKAVSPASNGKGLRVEFSFPLQTAMAGA